MDWRVKHIAQKSIEVFLPEKLGHKVHYRLQRRGGQVGQQSLQTRQLEFTRTLGVVAFLQQHLGSGLQGTRIMEVGTGWAGSDLLLFHLLGAEEIWTCDQLPHLDEAQLLPMRDALETMIDPIAERLNLNASLLAERFTALARCRTLAEVLTHCQIKYIAPALFHKIDWPTGYFDIFYSYSVLQRVARDDLIRYLDAAHAALKPGGHALHVIHHSDHNARHHRGLGNLDYLQYSDTFYNLLQSKRYNYQNRIRHADFVDLFCQRGFKTLAEELTRNDPDTLAGVNIARPFRHLPIEDLLVTRTQLLSQT